MMTDVMLVTDAAGFMDSYLVDALGVEIAPAIVGNCREGDIQHCVAGISRARTLERRGLAR